MWCWELTKNHSIIIYVSHICQWASIKDVMLIQTFIVLRATLRSLLFNDTIPRHRPTQSAISLSSHHQLRYSMSILEWTLHKLGIAYGLILVISSLCGWEAFSMPGALSYTRIILALSPTAPPVWGPPCAHGVLITLHGELRNIISSLCIVNVSWLPLLLHLVGIFIKKTLPLCIEEDKILSYLIIICHSCS